MSKYDIIVLGSGPGGYVTAIRASQLGFKTAVIEKESLGGVCLNWGCIPTKALLKSAQVFEYLKHAEDYGLSVKEYDKDFEAVVKRSRNIADGMSKGVQFLFKKNNIDVINGKVISKSSIIIDEKGVIRHSVINDLPLGRNIDEMLRMIDALVHHNAHGEVCPAGWSKGKTAMEPSTEGVKAYLSEEAANL